jgi:hypothetical protein
MRTDERIDRHRHTEHTDMATLRCTFLQCLVVNEPKMEFLIHKVYGNTIQNAWFTVAQYKVKHSCKDK